MSGKLIMKRKRADQPSRRQQEQQPEEDQPQQQQQQQHIQNQEELEEQGAPEKRHRPLTPPAEQPSEGSEEDSPNRILLEALQKIMELQSELDAFEQDLDERDGYQAAEADQEEDEEDEEDDQEEESVEDENLDAEVAAQFAPATPTPGERSQAEALGFAMCARETLLFLQSEGIPTESPLYQTLLGKLVGQSDGLLHA